MCIQGFKRIYLFDEERLVNHLPIPAGSDVTCGRTAFCISENQGVKVCMSSGEAIGQISFKRQVTSTVWLHDILAVETGARWFLFRVS